ncbi:RNA-directed DNA polymerase, eukaryota [Tanacetum coccineum]
MPALDNNRFTQLDNHDIEMLERPCSIEEVKAVVWHCGSDKAPGPVYKIIAKMLAMLLTSVINNLISSEQSMFVKGRRILDGPLMVGEVMEWYKIKQKKLMIFKVDFDKAYDSLCWEYIDFVMIQFGFGTRWRNWIRECLITARLSILINGSPTEEIAIFRGLRQGDPLSPFLFILAMEGLHIVIQKAMEDKKITGAVVGDTKLNISHLFYADDVVFLIDWSHCEQVQHLLYILVFLWEQAWLEQVEGVIKDLEQLRARFFWGCQSDEKKIAWVAWDKVLASKDRGGLAIGSLASFNLALLQKWRWRFYNESEAMWRRVIKAIHGDEGGVKWRRDVRGGIEQNQLNALLILIANIRLQNGHDKARWMLDDQGIFSVAATRLHIDEMRLVGQDLVTRWCAFVPRKVHIFVWRVMLDRLPTRYNLSRRGLEIEAIFCPCCGTGMETISHVLFTCYLAKEVWSKIVQWCQVHMLEVRSFSDWASWCNQAPNVNNSRARLEVIELTTYDKRKVTEIKILDVLEQRIEKVGKHLNKAKEKMDFNKGKEKMVMETVTSDESSNHNPFQFTTDDTLKSSSEDTCSSDSTWEQKKASKGVCEDGTEEEEAKLLDVPMQTEEEYLIPLDIVYPHLKIASSSRGTNTRGQAHYGLEVPMHTEEEDPIPLEIFYPHPKIASSSRGTNTRGQAHYDLRSLRPIQEEVVVVKKPYNLVKETNVVLGLRAPKAKVECSSFWRKRNF